MEHEKLKDLRLSEIMKRYGIYSFCDCGSIIVNHKGNEYEPDQIECLDCGKGFQKGGNYNKDITKDRQEAYNKYLKDCEAKFVMR